MKCIHCGSDTKYQYRQSSEGRCFSCQHPFAFEPKTDTLGVTDGLFQRVIQDVSAQDTVFFTERQLWYEFNRRLWSRRSFGCGAAALLLAMTTASALLAPPEATAALGGALALGAMGGGSPANKPPKIAFDAFRSRYLQRWIEIHGEIGRLLPSGRGRAATPTGDAVAPELTVYSFDRALITDDAEIAAMLVANNFHFENNCAILSVDGYPPGRAETLLTMLRRNPQLTVFALHDASVRGGMLAHTLRGDRWFPDTAIRILDLGLRPQHAQKLNLIQVRDEAATCPPALREALTPEEVRWLEAGNHVELAALRPARLMRAVFQGFARANQIGPDGGGDGSVIWFYDGGADIYAADSFG